MLHRRKDSLEIGSDPAMGDSSSTPAAVHEGPHQESDEHFYANGIFADTGLPLCELDVHAAALIARNHQVPKHEHMIAQNKLAAASELHYGTIGEVDPGDLAQAGWGIVFHAKADQRIKDALQPLIMHRQQQAGDLCYVFENADGYQPGESGVEWLARHGVSMMPVDPLKGVPFYLLLIGSPEEIPFEFQYMLDIYWAVGRLHFDDPWDYHHYAQSIVTYEQARTIPHSRSAAIFATTHEFDQATQMFVRQVAAPLLQGDSTRGPLGKSQNFRLLPFVGKTATKESLSRLLEGKTGGGPPALLFTGSHGVGFRPDDSRLLKAQGALVCQDWRGWGEITSDDWFNADDIPSNAHVHGLVHFIFACYGAGCPKHEDFVRSPNAEPEQIAPRPLVAKLPQKLLAHPDGGALAVLGHVDRAWSYSFSSPRAGPQLQSFRDVMGRLLRGDRLGQATDQFDVRRAALSSQLADVLRDVGHGKQIPDQELARLWTARNDARNYIVLGDPAVRIRVEHLVDPSTRRGISSKSGTTNVSNVMLSESGDLATVDQPQNTQTKPRGTSMSSREDPSATYQEKPLKPETTPKRETTPMREPLDFNLGFLAAGFDPELATAWKEHVKKAYLRNDLMFDTLLKSFMQPYWNTVWMYRILFGIGVLGFVLAAVLGLQQQPVTSAVFGGLSMVSFLAYFVSKPLRSLEENLQFITWLGLLYNTYWIRLAYSLNEPGARDDISALQNDVTRDLERLIDKHRQLRDEKRPSGEEKQGGDGRVMERKNGIENTVPSGEGQKVLQTDTSATTAEKPVSQALPAVDKLTT